MAVSLAASIKNAFGFTADLVEGHNGIFEVAIGGQVLYTNQKECGRLPENEEILQKIREHLGYPPQDMSHAYQAGQGTEKNKIDVGAGCGCSVISTMAPPSRREECCSPLDNVSGDSAGPSCCSPVRDTIGSGGGQAERRKLGIEFMYVDLGVCTRCQGTETSLEEAVSEVARILEAAGVEVAVRKIHVQSEEQALELGFVSSPTIRINGRDIQLDVRENLCESCGDLCGEDMDCRVWVYQGKEYTTPPKAMIIDAILREVYGGATMTPQAPSKMEALPDNLKRFFAAMRKKDT